MTAMRPTVLAPAGSPATGGMPPPAAAASQFPDAPGAYEVLGALERVIASDELRASPQLVAFLAFVVETTRRGDANRIKAYTIAVEALGRGSEFDPETDSIVRVVAGRLRRALDKYYAEAGAGDPIVIELPRGSYVPVFRRRVIAADPVAATPAQDALDPAAVAPPQPDHDDGRLRRALSRQQPVRLAAAAILAIVLIAVLISWNQSDRDVRASTSASLSLLHRSTPLLPAPVVLFQPFDEIGKPPPGPFTIDRLLGKLGGALGRFDGINVVTDGGASTRPVPASDWPQYRLGGSVDYHPDGTATLDFRLVDASDGALVWSHIFDGLPVAAHPDAAQDAVVRETATAIAAPFGAIWARELNARDVHDPRRACVIELIEYWRKFNPALHERVRQCTEHMVADNPTDVSGFIGIATVNLRDSYLRNDAPGKPTALDQALQAALQAVKLKPDSARALETLSVIWFARGDLPQAWATAEKAMALNPYDTNIAAEYGTRLIMAGQLERGRPMLSAALAQNEVRPAVFDFANLLGAYLAGDRAAALQNAALIENDPSPFGLIARALVGNMEGDRDKAKQAIGRLVALNPAWGTDPQRLLAKFFPSAEIRDRLLHDLQTAGLRAGPSPSP